MSLKRRFNVYGHFWLRYLEWGAQICPWFIEPVFMFIYTTLFWIFCGKARNAVAENLLTLIPGSSLPVNQLRAFRVFWNFAWSMTDLVHVRYGRDVITWEIFGKPNLTKLENESHGALILTAHMGNYDLAAPVFAHYFDKPVHIVRAPERDEESQRFQEENRKRYHAAHFVVHYNEVGNMLGVELASALADGGVVAIQGDRILFDVSPISVPFKEGVEWQVPQGPFLLSLISKAEIHPVFMIRLGYRRYRVLSLPAFGIKVQGRDKQGAMRQGAEAWSNIIRPVMEQHWKQWFVFEPVFRRDQAKPQQQTKTKVSNPA